MALAPLAVDMGVAWHPSQTQGAGSAAEARAQLNSSFGGGYLEGPAAGTPTNCEECNDGPPLGHRSCKGCKRALCRSCALLGSCSVCGPSVAACDTCKTWYEKWEWGACRLCNMRNCWTCRQASECPNCRKGTESLASEQAQEVQSDRASLDRHAEEERMPAERGR